MHTLLPEIKQLIRKEVFILTLCFLTGFALRFYAFDHKSLWMDEVYTYEDSRDDFKAQIDFYQKNPAFLHPPLFFILTHQFYPFAMPERDLRLIPLIFGTLSVPMIYLLARQFYPSIALPCALSLSLMAYHITLSQDGRNYSFLMFFGMAGLFFLIRHLKTSNRTCLVFTGLTFAILFYTSYSSIPFILFSQILWLYRPSEAARKPAPSSFFFLSGITFLFILPWLVFVALNYQGQTLMDPFHTEGLGSLWTLLYSVFNDWVPYPPLLITSVLLLIFFPFLSRDRRNALVLLAMFVFPIGGLYLFCKLLNVTHFITSRYFINFLPLFLISLYSSLYTIEVRLQRLKQWMRPTLLFVILFVVSNTVILPLYYRSEKQDFRGLVNYLKGHLQAGDKIFIPTLGYVPGILHYLGADPIGRHHDVSSTKADDKGAEYRISFIYQNRVFSIYNSTLCCSQYVADGNRLWIIVGKWNAKQIQKESVAVLKGYFDGSFLNFNRFPTDASMYLFLWDPNSPNEKGIDMAIQ